MEHSEWKHFKYVFANIAYRNNGSSIELFWETANQIMIFNPVNTSLNDCVSALESFDIGDLDFGMDPLDLRKDIFQLEGTAYFFSWKNYTSGHLEEKKAIEDFLRTNNFKLLCMVMWIDGSCTASGIKELDEICEYFKDSEDCEPYLQIDFSLSTPAVNALLICKPISSLNVWTPFAHSLSIMEYRDNGTSVELHSDFLDKNMILKPINGSDSRDCVLALKSLDVAEWEMGLDLTDVRKFIFQDGVEKFFIRWTKFTPEHKKEIKDISAFLRKMKYKLKVVLFWINGEWNAGDMCALDDNVRAVYSDCVLLLQGGMCWHVEPSVNAILICEPL